MEHWEQTGRRRMFAQEPAGDGFESQLPKLDVVGSNPISRSIFSIICIPRQISSRLICLNRTRMAQILRL